MLTVEHLSYRYRSGPQVLRDVGFSLEDGQFMAILGNNGVGKSTMLKCFNRILTPDSGSVQADGEELLRLPGREIAKRMAFVAQSVPATQMTVHDMVMLGRRPYMKWGFTEEDHKIVHEAIDQLGVSHLRGRFLSQLSGGERQKVMLARWLMTKPRVLIIDEPTKGIDIGARMSIYQIIHQLTEAGIGILMLTSDMVELIGLSDRTLVFYEGKIVKELSRGEITEERVMKAASGMTEE